MRTSTKIRLTTEREDDVVVSTVESSPLIDWCGRYETAISINSNLWKVAEECNTLEEAIEGHVRFSEMSKEELMNHKYIG